ncbi:hypothetical protein [Pseudidiomarina aquimaris]|nr:hypothetical protein [Pseudidiomarina aquimaris]
MAKPNFDIDAALKQLREDEGLTGKGGILTPGMSTSIAPSLST